MYAYLVVFAAFLCRILATYRLSKQVAGSRLGLIGRAAAT
jgi:hypothetical protein